MLKLPKIIGHRGCAAYAPENTLEGIHSAADMGIEWVEFDVKLTKDQVPILFHDDTLERTTNGSGNVRDLTLAQIKELDAGSWFSDSFFRSSVPTLEEAVDVLLERNLGLNLEIKPCSGRERETAEATLDVLSHIWDDHERLLVSSFSHVALETSLEMAPDWCRGFLLPFEWPENWQEMFEYLEASTIHFNGNECSREHVQLLLEKKVPLLAYTINDAQRARLLQSWGVSAFFTDVPDVLLESVLTVH